MHWAIFSQTRKRHEGRGGFRPQGAMKTAPGAFDVVSFLGVKRDAYVYRGTSCFSLASEAFSLIWRLKMTSSILRFPCGSGCRTYVITSVSIEDTGVSALNANGHTVGWVQTFNPEAKARVATAIMDCLDAGKRFVQPDWAVLLRED